MKETTRKANTYLPYGMVFILIFEAAHIDLSGEDSRQLHHTDTYTAKSLIRMGYHLSNGQWRKKIFGQRVDKSSSEEEYEDDEQPHELGTTAAASAQEEETQTQEPMDTTTKPSVPAPPTIDMPAPPTVETSQTTVLNPT